MRFRGWLYSFGMKRCGANFQVAHNVILNGLELLEVGHNVYFAPGCVVMAGGEIEIGADTLFGPNCLISSNNHRYNGKHFREGIVVGKVEIGQGCWIGGNCSVVSGTKLHNQTLVAAGGTTNKDYGRGKVVVGGVPARIIKELEAD